MATGSPTTVQQSTTTITISATTLYEQSMATGSPTSVQQPITTGIGGPVSTPNSNGSPRREHLQLANTNIGYIPKFQVANIESLISKKAQYQKLPFLREQCKTEKPYFLAFAETHLRDDIKEAEFNIEGYTHETSHRKNRTGGGVIIYINKDLTYKILISDSDEMCSIVTVI